jgi:glc operon protein GlcG
MKRFMLTAAAVLATVASPALGARADDSTQHRVITLEGAQRVIDAAVAEAKRDASHGAIAVVDDGGNLIAVVSLDGTFPQAAQVAIGKAHTAAVFRKNTGDFEKAINAGRTTLVAMQNFTPLQGGVLISVGGEVVGAVGVSGTASQQQDEDVAKAGAQALGSR